jgi:hypothetical protein
MKFDRTKWWVGSHLMTELICGDQLIFGCVVVAVEFDRELSFWALGVSEGEGCCGVMMVEVGCFE